MKNSGKGWTFLGGAGLAAALLGAWATARAQQPPQAQQQAAAPAGVDEDGPALRSGYRAMTLALEGYQLRFLEAGVRVDVMVTFEANIQEHKEWVTATILQNVLALNVQQPAGDDKMGVLQLMLNPNEVQFLALAVDSGRKVTVALRPTGDADMKPMEMASFRKLFR